MKKGFLFLIPLLCLTGCEDGQKVQNDQKDQKVLFCEMVEESVKGTVKLSYNEDGDNLLSVDFVTTAEAEDESEKKLFVSSSESRCKRMKDSKGITCKVNESKNTVSVNLKMTISKMTEEEKENMDINDMMNYEDAKEFYEEEGYTCK